MSNLQIESIPTSKVVNGVLGAYSEERLDQSKTRTQNI